MDPVTVAIILVVAGLAFLIAEAVFPGGYLVIPGLDLFVIGIYGWILPDMLFTYATLVVAIVISIPVVAGTLWTYRHLAETAPPSTTVTGSLAGRTGTVVTATEPGTLKGKVRIGSDTWSADSEIPLEAGTEVVVESGEGVHVFVRAL